MEQILLTYNLHKETVSAIMMKNKNIKVKVRSPDGDTDYFDIVEGIQQGDTLAPYLFIIWQDYVLRMSNERKQLHGGKRKKQKIPHKLLRMWTTSMT